MKNVKIIRKVGKKKKNSNCNNLTRKQLDTIYEGKENPNRIEINSEEAYSNCCSVINCNLLIIL